MELSPQQLSTLASPMRAEIVEALALAGSASIKEIAAALHCSSTSLYSHFEKLEESKLIRLIDVRSTTRRPEKIYQLMSTKFSAQSAYASAAGRDALASVGMRSLKAAARSFSNALKNDDSVLDGPHRNTLIKRLLIRLDSDKHPQFNDAVDKFISEIASLSGDRGKIVEVALAVSPGTRSKRKA